MAIIKNEALMMGRGMVVVTRELGRELYPLVDDVLLMKVNRRHANSLITHFLLFIGGENTLLRPFTSFSAIYSSSNPVLFHSFLQDQSNPHPSLSVF